MNKAAHNGLQVSDTFVPPSLLLTHLPTVSLPEAPLFQHRQPSPADAMKALGLTFTLFILLGSLPWELEAQSLAEAASRERSRRARLPEAAMIYTNEALQAQAGRFAVSSSGGAPAASPRRPSRSADPSGPTREELGWSRRFLQVKAKLAAAEQRHQALRARLDDLNLKLQGDPFRQTTVTDPAHVYAPLIAQAERRLEQSRQVVSGARQELAELRERLRRSGKPRSWEDSRAALAPRPVVGRTTDGAESPLLRDRAWWRRQLSRLDQRFRSQIAPLMIERFQLVHRRMPQEGESLDVDSTPGLGLPPGVADITRLIRQLKSRQSEEKRALVERARRSGALPGWFR